MATFEKFFKNPTIKGQEQTVFGVLPGGERVGFENMDQLTKAGGADKVITDQTFNPGDTFKTFSQFEQLSQAGTVPVKLDVQPQMPEEVLSKPPVTAADISQQLLAGQQRQEKQTQTFLTDIKGLHEQTLEATKPTEQELGIQTEIKDITQQAKSLRASYKAGVDQITGQTIPMSIAMGQTRELENQVNRKLESLSLIQAPLVDTLQTLQSAREVKLTQLQILTKFAQDNFQLISQDAKANQEIQMQIFEIQREEARYKKEEAQFALKFAVENGISSRFFKFPDDDTVYDLQNSGEPINLEQFKERTGQQNVSDDKVSFDKVQTFRPQADDILNELLSPAEAEKLGVPFGTTKGQAANLGILPSELLTGEERVNLQLKLADNFQKVAKEALEAQRQLRRIDVSFEEAKRQLEEGGSINASSQGVLVSFQKLLDPSSVVRESEYARSGQGLSLLGRLEGIAEKLQRGGAGVAVKDLEQFVELGKQFYQGYEDDVLGSAMIIKNNADDLGLDITRILPPDIVDLLPDDDVENDFNNIIGSSDGMRTDRHNNPTAFTTDIAKMAGLKENVDYIAGDPFPNNPNFRTAKLIGDPVEITKEVIDRIGFYTASGKPRWSYISKIPAHAQWNQLDDQQKKAVIAQMYRFEGGSALKGVFA